MSGQMTRQSPGSISEMLAMLDAMMQENGPKTDAQIDAMGPDYDDDDDDDRPLYRLTEEGINEQIDATVERRGLQRMW